MKAVCNWAIDRARSSFTTALDLSSLCRHSRKWYRLVGMIYYTRRTHLILHVQIVTVHRSKEYCLSGKNLNSLEVCIN